MKSCKLCRSLHIQIQTQLLEFIDDINAHFEVAVSPGNKGKEYMEYNVSNGKVQRKGVHETQKTCT